MAEPATAVASAPPVLINNRHLHPGTEVTIRGLRGRFRYIDYTVASTGALVLNFVGGRPGHQMLRSFHPDRIKTVHVRRTTRGNTC